MLIKTSKKLTLAFDDTNSGKPVLVLLHAFPLSREMWRPQRDGLKSVVRVLTPDFRGFGGTAVFDGPASVDAMADDVADFLDAIGVKGPVVVGGLSMGGYVAMAFARRYSERLRGLILADTKAEPDDEAAKANRDKMIEFAKSHTAADVLGQMLPKMLSEGTRMSHPEVVAEVTRIATAQGVPGVVAALHALRDRPDAGPGLADVRVPTLVIVGAEDAITPPAAAEKIAARVSGAKLEVIAGAGHLANLEKPGEFNNAVTRFVESIAG